MKKILLTTFVLLHLQALRSQGVYQLWGMTRYGGEYYLGTLFSTDSAGNNFQLRHQFRYFTAGSSPVYTKLVPHNGKYYGMTSMGGVNDKGVIFEWDPVTNRYEKKVDFNDSLGTNPQGTLTFYSGKFYGFTVNGGNLNSGCNGQKVGCFIDV